MSGESPCSWSMLDSIHGSKDLTPRPFTKICSNLQGVLAFETARLTTIKVEPLRIGVPLARLLPIHLSGG